MQEKCTKKTPQKTKKKHRKEERGAERSEMVRVKPFCCAFKLGLVHLICKASLSFKSNLELVLSIILKEKELYESKNFSVQCRCLKLCGLLSFLKTTTTTRKFIY